MYQLNLFFERHFMCAHLRHFSIDRLLSGGPRVKDAGEFWRLHLEYGLSIHLEESSLMIAGLVVLARFFAFLFHSLRSCEWLKLL